MLVMLNFASKLEIDTSAETLLLKGDKDLALQEKLRNDLVHRIL